MITFRLDRIRHTYPSCPPKPSHPAQHTLIEYGIIFSHDHYLDNLTPRDYIYPVRKATGILAPATLDILDARSGLTLNWPDPAAPLDPTPAVEVRAQATLPYGPLGNDIVSCLFEWHAIPHLTGFFNVYIPT